MIYDLVSDKHVQWLSFKHKLLMSENFLNDQISFSIKSFRASETFEGLHCETFSEWNIID